MLPEFTVILEHMIPVLASARLGQPHLEPHKRSREVIRAYNINDAWNVAIRKYHMDWSKPYTQIVDIVPGGRDRWKQEFV
jgi:hypothetical protein